MNPIIKLCHRLWPFRRRSQPFHWGPVVGRKMDLSEITAEPIDASVITAEMRDLSHLWVDYDLAVIAKLYGKELPVGDIPTLRSKIEAEAIRLRRQTLADTV